MTAALQPPKRKNPLKRTRLPVPPPALRSRQWHMLTKAAAEGVFGLPTCVECGHKHYPPRDICPHCLSHSITFEPCSDLGHVAEITSIQPTTAVAIVVLPCRPDIVRSYLDRLRPLRDDCEDDEEDDERLRDPFERLESVLVSRSKMIPSMARRTASGFTPPSSLMTWTEAFGRAA